MRFSRLFYTLFISCLLAVSPLAQTAPAANKVDPQAASILASSFKVMGGANLAGILSTQSTAQVTFPDGTTATATLLTQGNQQFRVETDGSDGTSVFVLNPKYAASQGASGTIDRMSPLSVPPAAMTQIPLLTIMSQLSAPGMKITYVGQETANGTTVDHIRMQRPLDPKIGLGSYGAPFDIYIDVKSMLPVQITFPQRAPSNLRVIARMTVQYSNYKAASGILIPYTVRYSVGKTLIKQEAITQFAVNVAASNSDFELR